MNRRFSIRCFRESDMQDLLKIEHACFKRDAYDRNLFANLHRKCGDLFLVAERLRSETKKPCAGHLLGYMVTCTRSAKTSLVAELVSVGVDPEARREGVASALLDSTLRRLRRRGVSRISLAVKVSNRRALAFYRKYGFRQLRIVPGYYEDGKDAWLMVRNLP